MDFSSFEKYEESIQQKYDDIKVEYDPRVVLSIKILRFRNVSTGFFDYFDTPDPQFTVTCPKIDNPKFNQYKTFSIPDNVTEGEVNEEFLFVLPKNQDPIEEFLVQIKLTDRDILFDDFIGEQAIDASKFETDGKPVHMTLKFGKNKNRGEVDIAIQKTKRTSPDLRVSLGLCPEEKKFRLKRIPFVCEALKKKFDAEDAPRDEKETPIISLVASGGGYRAVIAMCGVMDALYEEGLVDAITYLSSLSGSAWYFCAALTHDDFNSTNHCLDYLKFHENLRDKMHENLFWDFVNPRTILDYKKEAKAFFERFHLPETFVNYFPGYLVSKHLCGKNKLQTRLSDFSSSIDTGKIPYLLIAALQVRNNVAAHRYHAYVERSAHEIYIPSYGIGFKPEDEGAVWNDGIRLLPGPEYPLHFTVGMTGCAFSILLDQYLKYGDEAGNVLFSALDDLRVKHRRKISKDEASTKNNINIASDDDDDDDFEVDDDETDDDDVFTNPPTLEGLRSDSVIERAAISALDAAAAPVSPSAQKDSISFIDAVRKSSLFTSRDTVIGRTAKSRNFARNFKRKRYHMNPFMENLKLNEAQKMLVKLAGHKCISSSIHFPHATETVSFVDAGIMKNVPTDAVLRPQRGTDVMIVIDSNAYKDDDDFDYQPILAAAAHAAQSGLKFPKIEYRDILKTKPKELLIFPSDQEDCPTVLWFTLNNTKFKNLKNYVPRTKVKPPDDSKSRKFNDFTVFGKGNNYSTFSFQCHKYYFEQLRELMLFNVNSHLQEIKCAIVDATARKRRKLDR